MLIRKLSMISIDILWRHYHYLDPVSVTTNLAYCAFVSGEIILMMTNIQFSYVSSCNSNQVVIFDFF